MFWQVNKDEKYGTYVAKSIVFLVRAVPEQTFGTVAPCVAIRGLFGARSGPVPDSEIRAHTGEFEWNLGREIFALPISEYALEVTGG